MTRDIPCLCRETPHPQLHDLEKCHLPGLFANLARAPDPPSATSPLGPGVSRRACKGVLVPLASTNEQAGAREFPARAWERACGRTAPRRLRSNERRSRRFTDRSGWGRRRADGTLRTMRWWRLRPRAFSRPRSRRCPRRAGTRPALRFSGALDVEVSGAAMFGLSEALWWLGHLGESVAWRERAFGQLRDEGDVVQAALAALYTSLDYRKQYGDAAAASGWLAHTTRLVDEHDLEPLRGWLLFASSFNSDDPIVAEDLARRRAAIGVRRRRSRSRTVRTGTGGREPGRSGPRRGRRSLSRRVDGGGAGARRRARHRGVHELHDDDLVRQLRRVRACRAVGAQDDRVHGAFRLPVPVRRVSNPLRRRARRDGGLAERRARAACRAGDDTARGAVAASARGCQPRRAVARPRSCGGGRTADRQP